GCLTNFSGRNRFIGPFLLALRMFLETPSRFQESSGCTWSTHSLGVPVVFRFWGFVKLAGATACGKPLKLFAYPIPGVTAAEARQPRRIPLVASSVADDAWDESVAGGHRW